MAINPDVAFPGKTAGVSPQYPYGKARDVSAPGDGTGTPLLASWVNDVFGVMQNTLVEAGVVPSGTPDDAVSSQIVEAMRENFTRALMRRAAVDIGLTLVAGSFEDGGAVTDTKKALWWKKGHEFYVWEGAYPKPAVPVGSTPTSSGGVGAGAWVPKMQSAPGGRDLVFASDYATPNTPAVSQHAQLQAAWDAAAAQGKTFVVDGVFWVLPTNRTYPDTLVQPVGLQVPNNSRALWLPGASIKAIASALPMAYIVNFYLAENFELWNPVVYGDVGTHTGSTGESYHCLNIVNCKDGYVHKPKAYDAWGDGIYIGTEYWGLTNTQLENVTIYEPLARHCGRNCISITSGRNVRVIRPTVADAFRTAPKSGIDIEPEGVGACLPIMDGIHVVGPIRASNCEVSVPVYLFPAVQGYIDVTVGDIYADGCKQPIVCVNHCSNPGSVIYGDVYANGSTATPVVIKWSQLSAQLKIGDVYAHNACIGPAGGERYKSIVSVDIDAESQPAGPIGNFSIGDIYITNSGANSVLVPFYFKDNTVAANRALDRAKIGKIYGDTANRYFFADGPVTQNFKFTMKYPSAFFQTPRRPVLYSEVEITASGGDFELKVGPDYKTDLTIVKVDLTTAPIKVYPAAGGTFYPLQTAGAGYLLTTTPGARLALTYMNNPSSPHFLETTILGTWTAV